MSDMMKAFWLGVFILVALLIVIGLVLFIKPSVGDAKTKLTVRFSNIDRVTKGTRVTFAGKPVGEVLEIRQVPDPRQAASDASGNLFIYELILRVDSSVKVYSYDEIVFATSGLMGEKSISIIPKAPPHGAFPAQNVTDEILYAQSTDKFEQTLTKITGVAETFGDTLVEVGLFVQNNNEELKRALTTIADASSELHQFFNQMNEKDFVESFTNASEAIVASMAQVEDFFALVQTGEGTLGRLLNSDSLYVQLHTTLCQVRAVLADIQNYGLLYQFDRKWQRMHDAERSCY